MIIVSDTISRATLIAMASHGFGDFVKAVVDIERGLLAVDAEVHSLIEALLLEDGSHQQDLWGINLYPEFEGDQMIEYDSLINLRPMQGNRTRGVDNPEIRIQFTRIVAKRVTG